MKSARRRSREFALQALYQWQIAGQSASELEKQYADAEGFAKADPALFSVLVKGVLKAAGPLGEQLTSHLDRGWEEVSPVERAILLLGAYELVSMPETPYRVILNEAIELAKSFGGTDGHKYVNGILDKLAAVVRADEISLQSTAAAPRPRRASKPTASVTVKPRRTVKT
jgi:N utilization substance protein B